MRWYAALGYTEEGAVFTDPLQGITGVFLTLGDARIELLEQLPDAHVLDPWLAHGSPLYHHGYEVPDLAGGIELLESVGAKLISAPKPAVAFDGRHVAFCIRSNRMMVELIEAPPGPS
jgi:methylmalonyl-CoA/ethylmalonyl-CoA epimerase